MIYYWPNAGTRKAVEGFKQDAFLFASQMHLAGFAESRKEKTKKFGDMITNKKLMRFK